MTKNMQEVKYLRQTDGSLKLQLPLISFKPGEIRASPPSFIRIFFAEVWLKPKIERGDYLFSVTSNLQVSIVCLTVASCLAGFYSLHSTPQKLLAG